MSTSTAEALHSAPASPVAVRPSLKLVALHLRGLKSIRALDLPEDGLGWQGNVPDVMLVGGINGCGKTTLLNFLAEALALITRPIQDHHFPRTPQTLAAKEAWVDFDIESAEVSSTRIRFVVGDGDFLKAHMTDNCWSLHTTRDGAAFCNRKGNFLHQLSTTITQWFSKTTIPSVVYVPDDRMLTIPPESYKAAGLVSHAEEFVYRWRKPPEWKDSLEALLYSLRWEDLNAKEEGRPGEATHFAPYAAAFRQFTGGAKELVWKNGELVVHVAKEGETHGLNDLSSGEKQVLLLTGELLRHWRPGSLILIDEPELHLHPRWQHALYDALTHWQQERGGQVILATHSLEFVHRAGFGSAVLLGKDPL